MKRALFVLNASCCGGLFGLLMPWFMGVSAGTDARLTSIVVGGGMGLTAGAITGLFATRGMEDEGLSRGVRVLVALFALGLVLAQVGQRVIQVPW